MQSLPPLDTLVEKLLVFRILASDHGLVSESLDHASFSLFGRLHIDSDLLELLSKVHGQVDFFLRDRNFFTAREKLHYRNRTRLLIRYSILHEVGAR